MADMLEGANFGAAAGGGQFPLEQWFYEMPICTRTWTVLTIAISVLVQCHIVTPLQLFFSVRAVFLKNQFWRLLTTFLYFGPLSLDLLLHVFFLQRYSRLLEENPTPSSHASAAHLASPAAQTAAYTYLLLFAGTSLILISSFFVSLLFLGHALSSVLVYIWSRRNPDTRLSFLGLLVFRAPFLPWVLCGFSLLTHGVVPREEICGIVVGHVYYFLTDVFPPMHDNCRPLDPPSWWIRLFEGRSAANDDEHEGDTGTAHGRVDDVPLAGGMGGQRDLGPAAPEVR